MYKVAQYRWWGGGNIARSGGDVVEMWRRCGGRCGGVACSLRSPKQLCLAYRLAFVKNTPFPGAGSHRNRVAALSLVATAGRSKLALGGMLLAVREAGQAERNPGLGR